MEKRGILLWCLWVCFLDIVQPSPVAYRHLSKKELNQIALDCIDEVKIDRAIIERVLLTQILPKDDQKYKEYLACSYKKQGYLSPDGKNMLYENVFQFLERFYTAKEVKTLNDCQLIQKDDPGELCFQNLVCILEGLKKIERDNETNEI